MAKKSRSLLVQHLEKISWRVLEAYPEIVRDMIHGKSGVYALYKRDRLYYVGLAGNLRGRLRSHLKDRHHGAWDRFSVYLTGSSDHVRELESFIIRIVAPTGNRAGGRFPRSETLLPLLNRRIKEVDADRRAFIVGGPVAKRRAKTKAKHGLAGIFDRRVTLRAQFKGEQYKASLRTDGTIRYRNRVYPTPTAAARAVVGRYRNGWKFWHYKTGRGKWEALNRLRR